MSSVGLSPMQRSAIPRPLGAMGQGYYWARPQAPPAPAAAAAAAAYSAPPPAAASYAQAAPIGTVWERDEEWIQEQRLCQTAMAVAGLVFRDEGEEDGGMGMQVKGDAADSPISEKRLKCMTKRAYYKRRRKARLAAQHVLEGLLARVDAVIDARSAQATAAAAASIPASAAEQEQP